MPTIAENSSNVPKLLQLDADNNLIVIPKAKGKTTITKYAAFDTGANNTLYTVTTGKTFYLVGASVSVYSTAAITTGGLSAGGDFGVSTGIIIMEIGATATYQPKVWFSQAYTPSVPMPFAAGTVFSLYKGDTTSTTNIRGCIMGWEE